MRENQIYALFRSIVQRDWCTDEFPWFDEFLVVYADAENTSSNKTKEGFEKGLYWSLDYVQQGDYAEINNKFPKLYIQAVYSEFDLSKSCELEPIKQCIDFTIGILTLKNGECCTYNGFEIANELSRKVKHAMRQAYWNKATMEWEFHLEPQENCDYIWFPKLREESIITEGTQAIGDQAKNDAEIHEAILNAGSFRICYCMDEIDIPDAVEGCEGIAVQGCVGC